ncbi:hypothetical protein TKK_0019077 [Trichogramma kaykai]
MKVDGEKLKASYLLHYVGDKAYNVLCDNLGTSEVMTKEYKVLTEKLREIFALVALEIAKNFKFNCRKQQIGESVKEFATALNNLSATCKFGDFLRKALRNQFVYGLICEKETLCENPKHKANSCTLPKDIACNSCGKQGHLAKVCMRKSKHINQLEEDVDVEVLDILQIDSSEKNQNRDKFIKDLLVYGNKVTFEVDSEAGVSVMYYDQARKLFPGTKVLRSSLHSVSYCKTSINVRGYIRVTVQFDGVTFNFNLYLTSQNRGPLCGREWIHCFIQEFGAHSLFTSVLSVETVTRTYSNFDKIASINSLKDKYKNVIQQDLSPIKILGIATLSLKPDAKPKFIKSRRVPFRLVPLVNKALESLEREGIIERVNASLYATPIVTVLKKDGTVRICGDYSVTVNSQLIVNEFPMPTTDEILADLAGCEFFAKIDCTQAYLQLPVDAKTADILTINTQRGMNRVWRLMFGIAAAPAIWQVKMMSLFRTIKGVRVFQDDLRLAAATFEELTKLIHTVLKILDDHNVKLNLSKSVFLDDKIIYCGFVFDAEGVHKDSSKFQAVIDMPPPANITELRSFIGMITYYNRFMKDIATVLDPLYELLRHDVQYTWTDKCQKAFVLVKKIFTQDNCLTLFNPKLPLVLATDVSPLGVGAVLSHILKDGSERPICFISQRLNKVRQKYSQIDREAFAIFFAIKKLHQYLYGHKFTLICDNLPLVQIFNPNKSLPTYSDMRMQHYALFLRRFTYDIKYRRSEQNSNADCLSRLLMDECDIACDVVDLIQKLLLVANMDKDIEELVRNNQAKVPIHEWEPAVEPFERVHVDFAGPFMNPIFFVLVYAYSKRPEVDIVKNMLAETTVEVCQEIFA